MYSQGDEERVIVDYFRGRVGAFLDVGANLLFSNTRRLAELEWTGLAIEPDPFAAARLLDVYRGRPAVKVLQAVIAERAGIVKLHSAFGDGISTIRDDCRDRWADQATFRDVYVPALLVADVLERFPGPYQFVNIDVEGCNLDVLRRMPLTSMGAELVCVEHDGREATMLDYLTKQDMARVLLQNAENLIVAKGAA